MNKFEYKRLHPFKWFVLQNFPFIEADFDAITEYQLFCKVVEYLNKVIDDMNSVGQQTEDITNAMTDLQNYVNNYLTEENLQPLINNKLNEMATDGTLENIINQEIFGEINNRLDNLEMDYTIMIGDSFIAEYQQNNNWAVYLKSLLGLNSSNCLIIGEGGSGFYSVGNQNTNWLGLLQANINNIPDANKVTRIIVGGGTNDINTPDLATLLTSISNFHTYIRTTFPNAKLYVAEFGYFMKYSDVAQRNKINNIVIPAYKIVSRLVKSKYLNTELCYRDLSLYNTPTENYVHPNDEGQHVIAGAINDALNGQYKVERRRELKNMNVSSDITANNLVFLDILDNGIHTLNLNGNITLNKQYVYTQSLNLNIGTIDNLRFIRKSDNSLLCFSNISIRVSTTTSTNFIINNCRLTINENGEFILSIPAYAHSQNIENIASIIIQTTITFDSYNW